jgi:hypothetical protein
VRPVCVFAETPGSTRAQIADLLGYHPATVRRWLHRYDIEGISGLPDRPRPGRPRLGGTALTARIASLLAAARAVDDPPAMAAAGPASDQPAHPVATHPHRGRLATTPPRTQRRPDHDRICARIPAASPGSPSDPSSSPQTRPTSTCYPQCAPPGPSEGAATGS